MGISIPGMCLEDCSITTFSTAASASKRQLFEHAKALCSKKIINYFPKDTLRECMDEMHAKVYVAKAEEWNVRKKLFSISINKVSSVRIRGARFFHHIISHTLKVPALEKRV